MKRAVIINVDTLPGACTADTLSRSYDEIYGMCCDGKHKTRIQELRCFINLDGQSTLESIPGPIDSLVVTEPESCAWDLADSDFELTDRIIEESYKALLHKIQQAITTMVKNNIEGQSIVFLLSSNAIRPSSVCLMDSMLSAGLNAISKTLAVDFSELENPIRVNTVFYDQIFSSIDGVISKENIPLKRGANAQEIGAAVQFLLSDAASYITGSSLNVDGGSSLRLDGRKWRAD